MKEYDKETYEVDFKDTRLDIIYKGSQVDITVGKMFVKKEAIYDAVQDYWYNAMQDFNIDVSKNSLIYHNAMVVNFIRTLIRDAELVEMERSKIAEYLYNKDDEFKQDIQEHAEWVFREE